MSGRVGTPGEDAWGSEVGITSRGLRMGAESVLPSLVPGLRVEEGPHLVGRSLVLGGQVRGLRFQWVVSDVPRVMTHGLQLGPGRWWPLFSADAPGDVPSLATLDTVEPLVPIWLQLWAGLSPRGGFWHYPFSPDGGTGPWGAVEAGSPGAGDLERHVLAMGDGASLDAGGHLGPGGLGGGGYHIPLRHRQVADWREEMPRPRFHTWLADWPGPALDTDLATLPLDRFHGGEPTCSICSGEAHRMNRASLPLVLGPGWRRVG